MTLSPALASAVREPVVRWATRSDLLDPDLSRVFESMRAIHDQVAVAHDRVRGPAYPWPRRPLYEWSRRAEYPFVVRELERVKPANPASSFRVLDAGSGVTFLPFHIQQALGAKVDCLDREPAFGARYDELAALMGVPAPRFIEGDLAAALPVESGSYDAVLCVSVLEHLRDERRLDAAAELWRAVRPGGLLVLTLDVSLTGEEDGLAILDVSQFFNKLEIITGLPLPIPRHLAPDALTTLQPGHGLKPMRVGGALLRDGWRARALRYLNRPLPTLRPLACLILALSKPHAPAGEAAR